MAKTYRWQGIDQHHITQHGTLLAANKHVVATQLLQQNIVPLHISATNNLVSLLKCSSFNAKQLLIFTQQFATLIKAGIPLINALDLLAQQQPRQTQKQIVLQIKTMVNHGEPLHRALQHYPHSFPPLYCHLMQIAAETGTLADMLANLVRYLEKSQQLRQKIHKASLYPVTVFIVTILISSGLLIFIIPQFATLFASVGASLPLLTRLLLNTAAFLRQEGGTLLLVTLLAVTLLRLWFKSSANLRYQIAAVMLALPFIGYIIRANIIAHCMRMLAITYNAGLPIVTALQLVQGTICNPIYRRQLAMINSRLQQGHSLAQCLQNNQYFPTLVLQMIAIGEQSGTLASMFSKISHYYEQQLDELVINLSNLFEPCIMLILGLIIAILVIAMYLPIFKLGTVL